MMMSSKLIAFALFGGAADAIRTNSRLDLFFCSAPEDGTTPSQSSHKKVNIPNRKLGGVQYGLKNEESPEMREAASKEVDDMDEQWTDFRDRHSDRKYIQLVHQAEMSILNTAFSTLRKAVAANAANSAAVEQFSATRKLAQTRFDNITQVEASWLESAAVLFGNTAYKSDEVVFPREPYSQDSFPAKVALSEIINVDMSFLEDAPSGKLFYQPRVNNAPFHEVSKVILSERNLDMMMVVQMRYAGWVVENDKWVIPIKSKKALKDVVNMAQKYGVSTDSELIYEPLREVAKAVANGTEGQVHKMTIRDAAGDKHFAVKILQDFGSPTAGEVFLEDIRQWQKLPVPVFAIQNSKAYHLENFDFVEAPEMQLTSVDGEKAVNAAIVSALVAAGISNVGSTAIMITPWATHGDINGAAQSLHPTDLFNLASDVLHANMVASLAPREIQFELSERFQHDWVKLTTSGFVINREEIEVTITAADVQQYQDVVMQSQGDRSALFIQSAEGGPKINDASKAHLPEPLRQYAGRLLFLGKNSSISRLWQRAAAENASLEVPLQRFPRVSADVGNALVYLRDLQGLKVIAVNGKNVDWNKNGLCSREYFHSLFTNGSTHRNDILTLQIANTTNNDIKPENIFVGDLSGEDSSKNESQKAFFLADPNISGTPAFHAPETLLRAEKKDGLGHNMMKYKAAGDVYAMGVMLARTIGLSLKQKFDFNKDFGFLFYKYRRQEGDSTTYDEYLRSKYADAMISLQHDIVKEYERVHVLPAGEEVQRKFEAVKRVMYQMLSFEATDRSTISALFEELHRDIQICCPRDSGNVAHD